MDLLGEVLLSLHVDANSSGIYALGQPWGLAVPATPRSYAHVVCCIDEPFWLMVDGHAPERLNPGDSVLLLHGVRFSVASNPQAKCIDLMEYWHSRGLPLLVPGSRQAAPVGGLELGEGEKNGRMLTLAFVLQAGDHNPLLDALPTMILLHGSASGLFPWIGSLLEFLVGEETSNRPGYVATANHLSQLIFTSFVRAHALSVPAKSTSWLRGIADKRIRQALGSMHAEPAFSWTIELLAEQAGMSRHTFGRRFTKLVGQSPIDYLIELRMQAAAEQIRNGAPIGHVAGLVGYQSERAFREVFKKRFGMPPLRYAKFKLPIDHLAAP